MSRRVNVYLALLGVGAGALTAAASAFASSGGGGLGPTPGSASGKAANMPFRGGTVGVVSPGNLTLSATRNGMTINARASTIFDNELVVTGSTAAGDAGDTVEIQRLGHQTQWAWAATTRSTVGRDGSFRAVWRTDHIGRFEIRAVVQLTDGSSTEATAPVVMVTVYRPAFATWFGPGLWGGGTACGERLTPRTLGVANRTLPCGERVAIYYRGRTIVVPVIDRGPYANGADWDLTEATARAIGMLQSETVGAVSLPRRP